MFFITFALVYAVMVEGDVADDKIGFAKQYSNSRDEGLIKFTRNLRKMKRWYKEGHEKLSEWWGMRKNTNFNREEAGLRNDEQ